MKRVQVDFPEFSAVYCLFPPTDTDDVPQHSEEYSIGLAFTGHTDALTRQANGITQSHDVTPGTGGMSGGDAHVWIRVAEPFEGVEFRPSKQLRQTIADELGVPGASDLSDTWDFSDPVLWAASVRVRAQALGGTPLTGLEATHMMQTLTEQMMLAHFGGRLPRATSFRMDERRLARVHAFIEDQISEDFSIAELADVAALSRSHFTRAFKVTTGMTPHDFVTSKRMERVKQALLKGGTTLGEVAEANGYTNGHHFRAAFRRQFGVTPADFQH